MFLNILVAIDGSPASRRALEHAIDLARAQNSKLTVMSVASLVSPYVPLAGVGMQTMAEELDRFAARVLAEALKTLPEDVIAHTVQRRGHPGPEIVEEIKRGGYDLVVLGSRGRGKAQEGLLGSVNGYVHFNSRVPILSLPDDGR